MTYKAIKYIQYINNRNKNTKNRHLHKASQLSICNISPSQHKQFVAKQQIYFLEIAETLVIS